ncbi:DUF4191 domain-containing protein [Demetria terragena]|uniref:DUF4191 domain-containing protein n=1 Tax=Demetria terragena TaxID=63959 RepID=UPI00036F8BD9|nr:DUF4191 domain-containing protein [Demetria terragena]
MADTPEKKSRFRRKPKAEKASKEPGRLAQIKQVYQQTQAQDPNLTWILLLAFLVVFGVFLLIGFAIGHPVYLGLIGFMLGLIAVMFLLGRRAEKAAYGSIAGTPGASGAAMSSLRRGWMYEKEPVAADAGGRTRSVKDIGNAAMVFRAVGRPGVVLVGEGPKGAAVRLLKSESRKVNRVAGPEVPVHTLRVGTDGDAVPVGELTKRMGKLDKKLTKAEVDAVTKRLRALGGAKPPIPQGMDPRNPKSARMDRKALRGR